MTIYPNPSKRSVTEVPSVFIFQTLCSGRGMHFLWHMVIGFGGLGVACRPLVPKFAGSNPAEA